MNVILVVPGSLGEDSVHLEDKFEFPAENLAIGYLSATLRDCGIECYVVDAYAGRMTCPETTTKILALATNLQFPIIGITVLQSTARAVREIVAGLRKAGCEAPVVLGGWFTSPDPVRLLEFVPGATYLLRGEAERSFVELVRRLTDAKSLEGIPGLVSRAPDGTPIIERIGTPPDLDGLPNPIHYLDYRDESVRSPIPIQSSRGCHWGRCTFCSTTERYGPRSWRMRSVGSVLEELRETIDRYDSRNFCFVDDEFFGPCPQGFDRAEQFARQCIEMNVDLRFSVDCRVGDVRPSLFAELKAAGLTRVFIGVEAGNRGALQTLAKGYEVEDVRRDLDALSALGIVVQTGFIAFNPYMTLEDARANIRFLAEELGHSGNPGKYLSVVYPEHRTPMWNRLRSDGLLVGEYPEWGFRFRDARVERLFYTLRNESASLRDRYLSERLYHPDSTEQFEERRRLNTSFLRLFHDVYRDVESEDADS